MLSYYVLPLVLLARTLLLLCGKASAEEVVPKVGDQICISGYIMDTYCIDLGVLLDDQDTRTLSPEGPTTHSVHCLIDVPQCNISPFEVLNELDNGDFGRSWRLNSNDFIIDYAHKNGGCSDCIQPRGTEGVISEGLRLTLTATVVDMGDSSTPPTIDVASASDINPYEDFDLFCSSNPVFVPPNGMITSGGGSLLRPILIHGSLMLVSWGFLLPSGAIIAAFGKHRPGAWWFKVHRVIQPIGLLFAIIAWSIALHRFTALQAQGGGSLNYAHAVLGMTTMVIGLIQPVNAIIRPHPPNESEDATVLRVVWQICHKGLGWTGIALGLITIGIGTTLIIDETHAMIFQICFGVSICIVLMITVFLNYERMKQAGSTHVPTKEPKEDDA